MHIRSFLAGLALMLITMGFQCGHECFTTTVTYEPASLAVTHLDYSGARPVVAGSTAPRTEYGFRLTVTAAVYDSLLLANDAECADYQDLAPALALEIKTLTPFSANLPAGADVTERFRFVPLGACCPNEHEPAIAGAPIVSQQLAMDPRAPVTLDFFLAQPPLESGDQQFEVTLLLSGQKKLVVISPVIALQ